MAGSIPSDFVREIVDVSEIVSLIDSYMPLKKKGKDHWGICPFCDDGNNPSFSVSEQKQFYYCFKCRATGNVISFLQAHQGFDFVESVEALASKAGLEVPYESARNHKDEREPIFKALEASAAFYESVLANKNDAQHVRDYLKDNRKISGETCRRFAIGYAPNSWSALSDELKKQDFDETVLIKAGLVKKNKDGGLYDIFRDRLIFPIRDRKGRVVGFGGRVMNLEDQPKYLNTGDTPVFQKGKELYGLYESLENRRDLKDIYVVEGYMDTVAMSENKINNAVATLGIATNRFHVQKLLQLVSEITFCFDGDDAGRGAAWGALKNVLPVVGDGTEIRFLFLPEGEDPASLLEKESKEEFRSRSESSLLLSQYFIQRLAEAVGVTSLEKKASLASRAMQLLKSMPESSIKKLLEEEVSKVTGLKKEDIQTHNLTKTYQKRRYALSTEDINSEQQERVFEQSGLGSKALSALIFYPGLISELEDMAWLRELDQPETNLLIEVAEFFFSNPNSTITDLLSSLRSDSSSFIGTLLATTPPLEEKNALLYFCDCLELLKKSNSKARINDLKLVLSSRKLSEDETFELQQHLLSSLDSLQEEDKLLLRSLSKANRNL
ncbi:DNA primase [Gammaproteobacteria bacterium]|nr:DNA primase [Gammaproteobacteria bacterium]